MSKCRWCREGHSQLFIDKDGTLVGLQNTRGYWGHAFDDYFWRCENPPDHKKICPTCGCKLRYDD